MSLAGPLYKIATETASVEIVIFYSCLAVLPGSVFLMIGRKNWFINRKNIFPVLFLSFLYTTAMLSFACATKNENPAIISLLSRSNVIFSFIISFLYFKDHFSSKIVFGILSILIGTGLLISNQEGLLITKGTLLVIYYALAFSIHNAILKSLKNKDFLFVLVIQNLLAVAAIFIFSSNKNQFFQASLASIIFSVVAGVLSSFFGFILYQKGLRLVSFSETTAVRSLSPVIALLVSYPFFPIEFDCYKIAGSILVVSGIVIFNLRRKPVYD